MFDKRILENVDWWLVCAVVLLMVTGFINLNSASSAVGQAFQWKQLRWYVAGMGLMLLLFMMDYRNLMAYAYHIYGITLVLLLLVLFVGKSVGGSQRWLYLGFFNLQPSEMAKIAEVVVLSAYFHNDERTEYGLLDLWAPFLLTMVPVALIYRQPDLGTALLLIAILGSMVCLIKIRWTAVLTLVSLILAALPIAWNVLKPYQRRRVETFLNPESDPTGGGYHLLQSKIAVGSGGILGKGYMAGTQAHLNFLPEVHTDFAFSIWAEEWGLAGAMVLLILYAVVLYRGLVIAASSKERFGAYLAFGITTMIFWQMFVNICMVIGLMPVVGIPLPLISYGGSSVIITLMGIGILLSVHARRYLFQKPARPSLW